MQKLFARFVKDESGATAIEYGLIAGGLAVAVFTAVQTLGPQINTAFGSIGTYLTTNTP